LKSCGVYLSLCTPLFFLFDGRGSSCSFKIRQMQCWHFKNTWKIDELRRCLWQMRSRTGVDSSSAEADLAKDSDGDGVGDAISGSQQPRRFPNLRNFWPWRYKKKIVVSAHVKNTKRKVNVCSYLHEFSQSWRALFVPWQFQSPLEFSSLLLDLRALPCK
jgi:hypothetical protein